MKRVMFLAGMAIVMLCMVTAAQAITMPGPGQDGRSYLHVGDPPDSTHIYNGEVTALRGNIVSILDVNGPTVLDPIWLVLGIANVNGSYAAPTIKSVSSTDGSIVSFSGPSYAGSLDAGENVYLDIFGIRGDASQSFTNWNLAQDAVNGFTATNYGIFAYMIDVTGGLMAGKDMITIAFNSDLVLGTYAIAIGQVSPDTFATTPFTEAGLKVPEPSIFWLFGSGMLALGFFGRKK